MWPPSPYCVGWVCMVSVLKCGCIWFGCLRFAMSVCPKMQTQMQMEISRTMPMIAMMISSIGMPATGIYLACYSTVIMMQTKLYTT